MLIFKYDHLSLTVKVDSKSVDLILNLCRYIAPMAANITKYCL